VGRAQEALPLAERAVELSPGDAEASALRDRLRATTPKPQTPEAWLALSLSEYQAQRYDASISASREALTLRPMYAEAYNNLCAAENVLQRFEEAAADCQSALAIKPDFPLATNNLAVALRGR
jgi:tetratricopeptide (TPR) repeat protein